MTTHSVTTVFNKKMAFIADINGHKVAMDTTADEDGEDSAPSPKRLMLASLTGCTGMDVVMILNKMKVPFSDFSIEFYLDFFFDFLFIGHLYNLGLLNFWGRWWLPCGWV